MTQREINATMARRLDSELITHIGEDHIHTDFNGWYYYIPAKSLQECHPLIMKHYRGPFFVVIPHKDNDRLLAEEITVDEYVDSSYWSFGHFSGGGDMLRGVSWMPLEEGPGIHDYKKINRYMKHISHRIRTGAVYTAEDYDMGLELVDNRVDFAVAVKKRIRNIWKFEANLFLNQENDSILMFPGYEKNTVQVYLPEHTLIDMLYHPGKYDVEELAESLKLEIGNPCYYEGTKFCPSTHKDITEETPLEEIYEYWKQNKMFRWFPKEDDAKTEVEKNAGFLSMLWISKLTATVRKLF